MFFTLFPQKQKKADRIAANRLHTDVHHIGS
jgi:hypothetical protein